MAARNARNIRARPKCLLSNLLFTATVAFCAAAPATAQPSPQAAAAEQPGPDFGMPVQIYRGSVLNWTPVWIELADLGGGRFVLTTLDGLADGEGPLRTYLLQSNGRRGAACRLRSVNGFDIAFRRCPDARTTSLDADLMGISSPIIMTPVSADAAFGYGALIPTASVSTFDNFCSFERLSRRDIFPSGAAAQAGERLRQALSVRRERLTALAELDALRTERLNAINTLIFTNAEIEQLAYIDNRMNRIMDFRYRMPYMQQRQQLEQQFATRPDRVAARQRIGQIDSRFASIYAPSRAGSAAVADMSAAAASLLAATDQAITEDIGQSGQLSAQQAIFIEATLDGLDNCATVNGLAHSELAARRALANQFASIAPRFQQTLNATLAGGESSSELAAQLQAYRSSAGLTLALANIGASDVLASAETRVQALANLEVRQREAAARQSAQAQTRRQQAGAAQQTARSPSTASARSAPSAATRTRGGAPSARQIRDALVYEQTYGRVTVGDALGLAERSADYDAGISRVTTLGVTFELSFAVDSPQCRAVGNGRFSCSYALNINNSLGIPYSGRGSHTFELRDGIWRSPTFLAAIIESGNRSAAGASNPRNCTVQGFGTPEGPSLRDQNGLSC